MEVATEFILANGFFVEKRKYICEKYSSEKPNR
jgi:hypothetical protein